VTRPREPPRVSSAVVLQRVKHVSRAKGLSGILCVSRFSDLPTLILTARLLVLSISYRVLRLQHSPAKPGSQPISQYHDTVLHSWRRGRRVAPKHLSSPTIGPTTPTVAGRSTALPAPRRLPLPLQDTIGWNPRQESGLDGRHGGRGRASYF
jgi:hypothetical protein